MLYDRPYMRERGDDPQPSPLTWIISAVVAGFVLQVILVRLGADPAAFNQLAVSPAGLQHGHVWTLLTYGFVHSLYNLPYNLLDLLCVVLALYFLGRELLPLLGPRRFVGLYAAALVAGALFWAATNWRHGGALFGATPAIDALLIVFACFFPNQEITFLLFFLVPVRLKPKYIAGAVALFDLFGFAFYEVRGEPSVFGAGFAHSAHLGGMLAGWLYFRFVHEADWSRWSHRSDIELPRWLRRSSRGAAAAPAPAYRVNLGNRADLRAEVDRILDKINSDGFGALTEDEKRVLDEARDLLSKR